MKNDFDAYSDFYDKWNETFTSDIPLWLEYAKKCGSPVLELCCGTGRILIPLAKEGIEISGLDVSKKMLDKAKEKMKKEATDVRKRVTLHQADMRNFNLKKKFHLIFIPYNSFQVLLSIEEQNGCLNSAYKHLTAQGKLMISIFHPDLSRAEGVLRSEGDILKDYPQSGDMTQIYSNQFYDKAKQIIKVRFFVDTNKSDGKFFRKTIDLKMRYFFPAEFDRILYSNGFETEELFGDYDKSPLKNTSPFMIFVAKKRS
ncbi:MAG: class I SAM-dependent methyltransferase [candidate division Zixibacteria bacterium]|nr:class I SAM-dependent methyltransferase [candidate division Zixibacteria bacterium]